MYFHLHNKVFMRKVLFVSLRCLILQLIFIDPLWPLVLIIHNKEVGIMRQLVSLVSISALVSTVALKDRYLSSGVHGG